MRMQFDVALNNIAEQTDNTLGNGAWCRPLGILV